MSEAARGHKGENVLGVVKEAMAALLWGFGPVGPLEKHSWSDAGGTSEL